MSGSVIAVMAEVVVVLEGLFGGGDAMLFCCWGRIG